jgi:hypothetical protein
MDEGRRREIADRQIAELGRASRQAEAEGRYRDAQAAVDAAADWDFWAVYGVERSTFEQMPD